MKTVRLELRTKSDKIAFGRTMSYDERAYEISDVVRRFFELASGHMSDKQIASANLKLIDW